MRCLCAHASSATGGTPARTRPTRAPPAAAAAAAATPLPLLPFWQEFRSQVARLEGVEALPLPRELATAQGAELPVSLRAGACHADRLRFGHFVFVNTGRMGKRRRRQRKQAGDEADSGSSTANGSSSSAASSSAASSSLGPLPAVSLLQGALLPSLFSFHPPLAFQALAFNGGQSWMVAVELGTLPPQEQAAGEQQAGSGSRASGGSSSGAAGGSPTAAAAADADAPTVEGWQAGQIARFAALRQLYSGIAAPLPPSSPLLQQATDGQVATAADMQPAEARRPLLLFSSLPLQAASIAADASLERDGAAAFRQSLALHLNGLASAPADASPQHVARMAAAQLAWLREQRRHPLLCAAHLEAAFGREWLQQLQEHLAASSEQGLAELLASSAGPAGQQQEQQRQDEWVLVNPAQLLEGLA